MAHRGISSDARFGSVLGAAWSKVFFKADAFLYQILFIWYKFRPRFKKYGGMRDVR